ncbi:class I SAM-dependent methyltransferase [Caulobacter mirabilis]|uniref:Methyltransferase type 11 n=1 Tax=Caulobacter mirabilis TaxID=69666 RepID=A0A2D2AUS5_9CAUL|nr:methyltransferase domain-containing protein [Caulobacter mirabilis]ATQ41713.1 methyltransferase type 11 [Caulobacter mirabilis]
MRRDVLELRTFYASPRGRAAREMVARKLSEAWGDPRGLEFLGLGYATPYLESVRERARRAVAVMPASQGVEVWPVGGRNLAVIADETSLPLPNAVFDRVVCVHALEEADDAVALMREVCRVTAPSGRVIVAVAARNGLWSNAEGTPFGHGRPWSRRQLENVLREADLEPSGWTRALYAPPFTWTARWAEGFEQAGAWLWPPFAGLILMEAVKQTYAVKPRAVRARARVFAPVGGLAPAPPAPAGRASETGNHRAPLARKRVSP